MHFPLAYRDLAPCQIQRDIAISTGQDFGFCLGLGYSICPPAQERTHPSLKLALAKGFSHVVIGSLVQNLGDTLMRITRENHHAYSRSVVTYCATITWVIEQDQVRFKPADHIDDRYAFLLRDDFIVPRAGEA